MEHEVSTPVRATVSVVASVRGTETVPVKGTRRLSVRGWEKSWTCPRAGKARTKLTARNRVH
jgi:hypothetical protein